MCDKRRQGRPKSGQDEVGAHYILQNAREALRGRAIDLSSRKEISSAVGVTPALISYYFPRGVNLADLILSPVILSHLHRANEIIESSMPADVKLLEVTDLLIGAFRRDRNLFDAYSVMLHSCNPPEENLLEDFRVIIGALLKECEGAGFPAPYPTSVQHGAFWGMCRAAADLDVEIPVEELLSLPSNLGQPRSSLNMRDRWLGVSSDTFTVSRTPNGGFAGARHPTALEQ